MIGVEITIGAVAGCAHDAPVQVIANTRIDAKALDVPAREYEIFVMVTAPFVLRERCFCHDHACRKHMSGSTTDQEKHGNLNSLMLSGRIRLLARPCRAKLPRGGPPR